MRKFKVRTLGLKENVNYPTKEEVGVESMWVVRWVFHQASGRYLRDIKRISRVVLIDQISDFCTEWRSPDDISVYTRKNLRYIKEKILSTMSSKGLLEPFL